MLLQAVTFKTESDMVLAASKLPLGSLAFVIDDETLFVRIEKGFREVVVSIFCCCFLLQYGLLCKCVAVHLISCDKSYCY